MAKAGAKAEAAASINTVCFSSFLPACLLSFGSPFASENIFGFFDILRFSIESRFVISLLFQRSIDPFTAFLLDPTAATNTSTPRAEQGRPSKPANQSSALSSKSQRRRQKGKGAPTVHIRLRLLSPFRRRASRSRSRSSSFCRNGQHPPTLIDPDPKPRAHVFPVNGVGEAGQHKGERVFVD